MNVETTIKTIEHLYQAYIVANANKKVPILKLLGINRGTGYEHSFVKIMLH